MKLFLLVLLLALSWSELFAYDPCCSFPCNKGICFALTDKDYLCDCTGTGFHGKTCALENWETMFHRWFTPSPEGLHKLVSQNKFLWDVINKITFLRKFIMKTVLKIRTNKFSTPPVYVANRAYPTLEIITNQSLYARTLPTIPKTCLTEMGIHGPEKLPSTEEVVKKIFARKTFLPCPINTNAMFPAFAQHFTHGFVKTDISRGPEYTWGNQNIDVTNIYGNSTETENQLRSMKDGKLKMQTINGEDYPMYTKDVPVFMLNYKKLENVLAMGHSAFTLSPLTSFVGTIYMREHNRVVTILKKAYPNWSDERLYQTGKLIVLGEVLRITVEDYVQHLSNYNFKFIFDPTIMYDTGLQFHNRVHFEFALLYHWHPLVPEFIEYNNEKYSLEEWAFNSTVLVDLGTKKMLDLLIHSPAGSLNAHNHGHSTLKVAAKALSYARQLRIQPFNQYRKFLGFPPRESFLDLTGNEETAKILKEIYKDVDAVELYVGLLVERKRANSMFGETITEMGGAYSLQGIFGNIFVNPHLWRPATFGGKIGFEIVEKASLRRLICLNVPGKCEYVGFKVPELAQFSEKTHGSEKDEF